MFESGVRFALIQQGKHILETITVTPTQCKRYSSKVNSITINLKFKTGKICFTTLNRTCDKKRCRYVPFKVANMTRLITLLEYSFFLELLFFERTCVVPKLHVAISVTFKSHFSTVSALIRARLNALEWLVFHSGYASISYYRAMPNFVCK